MLPVMETERLILRTSKLGDEKPLNKTINRSLPKLQRWMPWAKDPSLEGTLKNYCVDCVSGKPANDWIFIDFNANKIKELNNAS